jgi:hypothetical protein
MVAIVLLPRKSTGYFVAGRDGVRGEDSLGYSRINVSRGEKNGEEFDAALQV